VAHSGKNFSLTPNIVNVEDKMQSGYSYVVKEPEGRHFCPDFEPELTPARMLSMGVFGGKYLTDCQQEFPSEWFSQAKLSPLVHDKMVNFFQVDASKSLSYWREKGWIHEDDPRGWFQWYCRYYSGRRHADDSRQIKRWRAMRRHIAQIRKNCVRGDLICRPRQRQALLHWAYDSRNY
jgi:hypothetical protein